ncbi:MAG: adenylyl-sulfate kinase [Elusimicrobia bacterium]|nr:adenylyl-sulfate kinase [Elusimicrobiota bacterium]
MSLKIVLFYAHERLWHKISFGRREVLPGVLWFTGLSGSGKSTLSTRVFEELQRRKLRAEYLDGDSIRHLFPQTGFSKAERDNHIRRVGHLAASLEKHGVFVVASFVSPYAEPRAFIRGLCRRFVEIHVSTPLEVCEKRDVKGLYAKARRGEIKHFTGIDDPYEPPASPEISVDTSRLSEDEAVSMIMAFVDRHFIKGAA